MKVISSEFEEELGVQVASKEELLSLSKQVQKAVELQSLIDNIEGMLKSHKEELHNFTTRTIPDTMRQAKTDSFKTDTGVKVELKPFMNGSLPKELEARRQALEWLEDNGARDLIKTAFSVALGRGQKSVAGSVRKSLEKLGVVFNEKEDIHVQSLYAYARERMRDAQSLPLELLGLYVGTVAKIELPPRS